MADPFHYSEPLELLEEKRERLDHIPIHIEVIRREVENLNSSLLRIEDRLAEQREAHEKLLKFVESIDFGIYNAINPTSRALIGIRNATWILCIVVALILYRLFTS